MPLALAEATAYKYSMIQINAAAVTTVPYAILSNYTITMYVSDVHNDTALAANSSLINTFVNSGANGTYAYLIFNTDGTYTFKFGEVVSDVPNTENPTFQATFNEKENIIFDRDDDEFSITYGATKVYSSTTYKPGGFISTNIMTDTEELGGTYQLILNDEAGKASENYFAAVMASILTVAVLMGIVGKVYKK